MNRAFVAWLALLAGCAGSAPDDVLEDYRRAFGEEPGDIVAVGVLTDVGDDDSRRRAWYGDITVHGAK